eukprot:6331357-Pyramimonas_sp.AAC.1
MILNHGGCLSMVLDMYHLVRQTSSCAISLLLLAWGTHDRRVVYWVIYTPDTSDFWPGPTL